MKIEKLTYINERGESIEFSPASIYHTNMKDVTGLSDIRNEIFSINSMGQDGETYIGSRIESREIEITGHIKERNKENARRVRRSMTNILNPQLNAMLIYDFAGTRRVITCKPDNAPIYISSPIFEQFAIRLECPNPFWREELETRNEIAAWVGGFEFPIDRPLNDLPQGLEIPADGTWEIGWRTQDWFKTVINSGDVRTGIRLRFRALGTLLNPTLLNINTGEFIKINTEMQPNDIIEINTGYGVKGVSLRRQGENIDWFRFLDPDSTYLQLNVGENTFRFDADENIDNLEAAIYHTNLFLGV